MSAQYIEDLVEALEVRFLANRDEYLQFGLLTDFRDAHDETLAQDEALLRLAKNRIEALNQKYRSAENGAKGDAFFLFHRPRRWNPEERLWMGYERKRGKLAELNSLLRGGSKDCFSLIVGPTDVLSSVKYVITLDTDTQLPRDSARQFVAAMAHPLNRAHFDEQRQRVTEGYAHPAAARGSEPSGHEPVALCPTVRKRGRHRPVYAHCLRCLSGPVRRGFVHRQRHLRRRCVRAITKGTFSREPDTQSRPAGRLLCKGRAALRCAVVRGLSLWLQRGREPPPPLDTRGLADCVMVAVARTRQPRGFRHRQPARPPTKSAFRTVPMENLR